jgi:hypothetical protein
MNEGSVILGAASKYLHEAYFFVSQVMPIMNRPRAATASSFPAVHICLSWASPIPTLSWLTYRLGG